MSGLLKGVLSGPRWRESWVSLQSACLDHGSDELLELEKRIKQTITYFEEGQSENQRGVSQATRDSGRLRMSFEDKETFFSCPRGDGSVGTKAAAKWSGRRWLAEQMGCYGDVQSLDRLNQVKGSKALRQRVRKQSLELFVRVEILFWLRGLCLCDNAAEVPAATATAQGSTNTQGVKT
ncbi:hypothetical protein J3E69DRAFT_354342 [Trichoderma sp. SZMC 28015]